MFNAVYTQEYFTLQYRDKEKPCKGRGMGSQTSDGLDPYQCIIPAPMHWNHFQYMGSINYVVKQKQLDLPWYVVGA